MWQSNGNYYHFVRRAKAGMSEMLCGESYATGQQVPWVRDGDKVCSTCNDVSRLIHSTVGDLKTSLHYVNDLAHLRRAHKLAKGKTIKKMIQAKITRLAKYSSLPTGV
ncbi:MAG: hypothetical protein J0M11_01345 [Anaerolineae bacterium]|nr:hypothetical protein [Anaerolineae bacterium]